MSRAKLIALISEKAEHFGLRSRAIHRGKNFLSGREIFIAQLPKKQRGGKGENSYLGIERIVNDLVDRALLEIRERVSMLFRRDEKSFIWKREKKIV